MSIRHLSVTVLLLGTTGWSQEISIPLREGDVISGSERVDRVLKFRVTDEGRTYVEVGTDSPDSLRDTLVLDSGVIVLREGDPLGGGTYSLSDDFNPNNVGHMASAVRLVGASAGNESALFFDDLLIAQRGESVTAPQVPVGTIYRTFLGARVNDANEVVGIGFIDDPGIPGSTEEALLRYVPDDPTNPTSFTAEVLLRVGDLVPGFDVSVSGLTFLAESLGFNNQGDVLFGVQGSTAAGFDTAIVENDRVVASEGTLSPVAGRNYADLRNAELDLNDFGELVFTAALDGDPDTNTFLQKNGEVFVQENDVLAAVTPHRLESFDGAPVRISNGGDVYWFGRFDDPDPARDRAYFRNDSVILREGDVLGTDQVVALRAALYAFDVSDNGRFWIAGVTLQGVGDALVMADFGAVVPVLGCDTNTAELALADGLAVTGGSLTLELDDAQAVGALPILYLSTTAALLSPCGPMGGFGELLIGLGGGNPFQRVLGAPWTGTGVGLQVSIPPDPSLIDAVAYAQGLFVDAGGSEPLRATNALRIEVGAP